MHIIILTIVCIHTCVIFRVLVIGSGIAFGSSARRSQCGGGMERTPTATSTRAVFCESIRSRCDPDRDHRGQIWRERGTRIASRKKRMDGVHSGAEVARSHRVRMICHSSRDVTGLTCLCPAQFAA